MKNPKDLKEKGITLIHTKTNRTFVGISCSRRDYNTSKLYGFMIIDNKVQDINKPTTFFIHDNNLDYVQCDNITGSIILYDYNITTDEWNTFIEEIKDKSGF